mgnify:CR=1 FL=1
MNDGNRSTGQEITLSLDETERLFRISARVNAGVSVEDIENVEAVHNAGEIMSWPENVGSFATIFNAAGVSWTLSSDVAAYDGINYGLWYDDVQLARVAAIARESISLA